MSVPLFVNVAEAADGPHVVAAKALVTQIESIILTPLITLMFSVAFLVFLWGMYEFARGADNESSRGTGKVHMLWGIIGMFVMLSAYTLLKIAANTFNVPVP